MWYTDLLMLKVTLLWDVNERMGYFPAVGLAWNFQNEPLLEKARDKWLDEAKFRFSIGQSGRAPSGASVYLGAYVKGTDYMNMSATKQARMQLDNLKWETSTEYNYGLDASVLKRSFKIYIRLLL